jgi:ribosome-associated translation inhibitor RaiA
LTSCHVFVECAHEHHDETRRFHARIHMELPGGTLAVNHEHHARHSHADAFVAVRDAFDSATRQLNDWKRRHASG